jgi:hypothetical protein
MAVASRGQYASLYGTAKDLAAAARSVFRLLENASYGEIIDRLSHEQLEAARVLVIKGDAAQLRFFLKKAAIEGVEDLTFDELRTRASNLNISGYNRLNRAELIHKIRIVEEAVAKSLSILNKGKEFVDMGAHI